MKLLPQLWVEIFAFSSGNTASSSPLWFLCWCFLNLVLQAKLPDGSRPARGPGHSGPSGLMDEPLPCWSDPRIATVPLRGSGLAGSRRPAWRFMSPPESRPLPLNHLSEALRGRYLVEH